MITVYLDSQDYSALSEPQLRPDLEHVKNALLSMSALGEVRFVFSAVVVSEAAPTGSHAVDYAMRRGDILAQLCGRNALICPTDLVQSEVRALAKHQTLPRAHVDQTEDWFPRVEFEDPTSLVDAVRELFNADPAVGAMTRPQRREAERKLFKSGRLRPGVSNAIHAGAAESYVQALLGKLPMDPAQADVFRRYALGQAGRDEATEAMRVSLRDPNRLMRWFVANPEMAAPLADMVREPGRTLGSAMRSLVALAAQLKASDSEVLSNEILPSIAPLTDKVAWENWVSGHVESAVRGIALKGGVRLEGAIPANELALYCPGIDATVRCMLSSVWDNVGGARRQLPSDSQFPDAMHAMYAPYIDVFRADSYMAPHIRMQVERHGTQVVAKLRDLPGVLESMRGK
jgi:hypothetical protein